PLGRGIVGDIQLNPDEIIQTGTAHARLIQNVTLHDLAADAPVRGQLDNGRPALIARFGKLPAQFGGVDGFVEVVAAAGRHYAAPADSDAALRQAAEAVRWGRWCC